MYFYVSFLFFHVLFAPCNLVNLIITSHRLLIASAGVCVWPLGSHLPEANLFILNLDAFISFSCLLGCTGVTGKAEKF